MKPQIIRADRLTPEQQAQVHRWLKQNGCRWYVPIDSHIQVTGQHFTVDTFTFRETRQAWTLLPHHLPEDYELPTKTRKYRIRHELRWDK